MHAAGPRFLLSVDSGEMNRVFPSMTRNGAKSAE
jgi:hypothetical protein